MEFIKTSKEVIGIIIPEGECKKIVEAGTGRILWEKKLSPLTENSGHWAIVNFPTNKIHAISFVDYDIPSKKIMFVTHGYNKIDTTTYRNHWSFFYDAQSNKFSDFYRFQCRIAFTDVDEEDDEEDISDDEDLLATPYRTYMGYPIIDDGSVIHGDNVLPIDIDPISKTIITRYDGKNYAAMFSNDEHLKKYGDDMFRNGLHKVCWVPEKELFLLFWGYSPSSSSGKITTALMDKEGNIINIVQDNQTLFTDTYSYNNLCWAGDKGIFLSSHSRGNSSTETNPGGIWLSSNGLNWERVFTTPLGPSSGGLAYLYQVIYCSGTGTFLALWNTSHTVTIYKSTDGRTWEEAKSFEDVYGSIEFIGIAWSPKKKVACLVVRNYKPSTSRFYTSYITRDFENWVEIPIKPVVEISYSISRSNGNLKWSDALNAFVFCNYKEGYFLTLTIDN